jgi:hypothetical protein
VLQKLASASAERVKAYVFERCETAQAPPYVYMYYCRVPFVFAGLGLDDWCSRIRFPAGTGNFSLHHRIQNGAGAHPASYPMGTRGSFTGGTEAGV